MFTVKSRCILVAILVAAGASVVGGCSSDTPALAAAREQASRISMKGFRQVEEQIRGEGIVRYYVGPASRDVKESFSAKGMTLSGPDGLNHANHTNYETIWIGVVDGLYKGLRCRAPLSRLQPGKDPGYRDLKAKEKKGVKEGRLTVIEIVVNCLPPASP